MISRTILSLLLIACFCHGAQPPTPSKPTTDDERNHANQHAKLRSLNVMGRSDLRSAVATSPGHHVITYLGEPLEVGSPNPPKTAEEWVKETTCRSDLVVLGHVTKQISSLSENGGIVFSDYYFQINETLYARQPFNQERVVVVLPGGRVETPDGVIETRNKGLRNIPVGGPPFHLLFLLRITQQGMPNDSFHLASLDGVFFLWPKHPESFSSAARESDGFAQLFKGMTRERMIHAVKQGASACGGQVRTMNYGFDVNGESAGR